MRDETVLALIDVLENLSVGYKDCAQKICAAENALSDERGSEIVAKMNKAYVPQLGLETERWNELASRIETTLAVLRKELSQNNGGSVA